jgi:hypothetical protein
MQAMQSLQAIFGGTVTLRNGHRLRSEMTRLLGDAAGRLEGHVSGHLCLPIARRRFRFDGPTRLRLSWSQHLSSIIRLRRCRGWWNPQTPKPIGPRRYCFGVEFWSICLAD